MNEVKTRWREPQKNRRRVTYEWCLECAELEEEAQSVRVQRTGRVCEYVSAESEARHARRDVGVGDVRGELVVLEERDLERGEDGFVVRRADRRRDTCSFKIDYFYYF